jgi:hypothetical protein
MIKDFKARGVRFLLLIYRFNWCKLGIFTAVKDFTAINLPVLGKNVNFDILQKAVNIREIYQFTEDAINLKNFKKCFGKKWSIL